ncbi:MAG: RNA polymerase sigma factor [Anaerohalosphaeraceae bacterium]|nr:RNA polymerase sigma factor [Anaerohalosphaeraceae bacterium]
MNPDDKNNYQDTLVNLAVMDSTAFGLLYDIYYDKIFRYCLHRLYIRQVAEDVTSNVFLAAAGGIKKFRGKTRAQFACWLYKIATNKINQYLRQHLRREKLSKTLIENAAGKMDSNQTSSDASENWAELHNAILELSPTEQTIIMLRYFEGFTAAKIAEIMNVNPNTLRVKIFRAIEKLRNILKG